MGMFKLPFIRNIQWKLVSFDREDLDDRDDFIDSKNLKVLEENWKFDLSITDEFQLRITIVRENISNETFWMEFSGFAQNERGDRVSSFNKLEASSGDYRESSNDSDYSESESESNSWAIYSDMPPSDPAITLKLKLKVLPFQAANERRSGSNSGFDKLKQLFSSKSFCDFKFICSDGKEIDAHSVILAAFSPVLKTMLESPMREAADKTVRLDDIDGETMEEILHFMYTQEVRNVEEKASKLIYGAVKYDIGDLKKMCVEAMNRNITITNVLEYFLIADLFDEKGLLENCGQFTKIYYEELKGHADWDKFDKKQYKLMLDFFHKYDEPIIYFETNLQID